MSQQKDICIKFDSPDKFVGMVVEKRTVSAVCTGYRKHVKKDGAETFLLIFECTSKISGTKYTHEGSWIFNPARIPKPKDERNPLLVLSGKKSYAKRKSRN
jgi:hypothetical protein